MTGIVRGGLRPHHPTKHSFILVGLVVVVIILGYNWWSTSVKISRLVAEVTKLQKSFKVMRSDMLTGQHTLLTSVSEINTKPRAKPNSELPCFA